MSKAGTRFEHRQIQRPSERPGGPKRRVAARLLVLAVLLAGPPLMLHTIWANPVSAEEDDLIYYYPLRKMVGQALREGRWPLENPREACGSVLMGDPQSAILHPTSWMFAVLEAKRAYALSIWTGFWLAGVGMWLYARRLGLGRSAALFAAVAFTYCGFLIGHRVHLSILLCAAMLPWGLWCIETSRLSPAKALAWFVPVAFLALAAGHWPTMIHVGLIWAAYLLFRGRPFRRTVGVAALACLVVTMLAAPQLIATADALGQATRAKMGYAMAGENSFFPAAGLLATFPLLFGSRTPGFFPQRWWGPWHLCEMLGYVGLVTLVLAGAGVMRLYRRREAGRDLAVGDEADRLRPVVRTWTWIAAGAGVWMLGYYLPTYRLVHALPVLGMVRCPARMVLGMDLALAVLAGIVIHTISSADKPKLKRAVRRGAVVVLPVVMILALGATGLAAEIVGSLPSGSLAGVGAFVGSADDALRALRPQNPAVWVPLALMALTGASVWIWLRRPRALAPVLVALLLMDLFIPARFVDVPPRSYVPQDPDSSPAASWLRQNAPDLSSCRIWGLGDPYGNRQAELLLAKTCEGMGFATLSNYGPLHSPRHAHLMGFEIFGTNRNWEKLLRENYLVSLYNVRYLIAEAGSKEANVLQEVRVSDTPPPNGGQLLDGPWSLSHASQEGQVVRLQTPYLWRPSEAFCPARIPAGEIVQISLEARAPRGGAADELRADLYRSYEDGTYFQQDDLTLRISAERIGESWRRFTWTCRTPRDLPDGVGLRLQTRGERLLEVRKAVVRRAHREKPILMAPSLRPGQPVYRKVAELPALRSSDPPVEIYENLLYGPFPQAPSKALSPAEAELEALRWGRFGDEPPAGAPFIGLRSDRVSAGKMRLWLTIVCLCGLYLWIAACRHLGNGRRRTDAVSGTYA